MISNIAIILETTEIIFINKSDFYIGLLSLCKTDESGTTVSNTGLTLVCKCLELKF